VTQICKKESVYLKIFERFFVSEKVICKKKNAVLCKVYSPQYALQMAGIRRLPTIGSRTGGKR
jgi:hypothetical protein